MKKEKELILKMLEEQKITSEEAMKLFEQLEEKEIPKKENKRFNFGNMISNFVKNTVESAVTAAANSGSVEVNLGSKNKQNNFTKSYILKDKITNGFHDIDINLLNGDIIISSDNVDNPILKVYTLNYSEESELEKRFDINFDSEYLTVSELDEKGEANKRNFRINNLNPHFKLELTLPESEKYNYVTVSTLNGDIDFSDINLNDLNLTTANGDIDIDNINLSTINAVTSNGDINVSDTFSNCITLLTSRGDIELDSIESETIDTQTSLGDISISNPIDIKNSVRCSTSMGDIDVDLAGIPADIEVDASVDAPVGDLNFSDRFLLMDGNKRNRKVYTNTNFKKTLYVHLNTSFGDINVE